MTPEEELVLDYFFTNKDKPVFVIRNMPPTIQNYIYSGISRFPEVRGRFIDILKKQGLFDDAVKAIRSHQGMDAVLDKLVKFAGERNAELFFKWRHRSAGEGCSVFVVSEDNPIYATGQQQDFYFPMTTMETSTRFSRKFSIDRLYFDPALMKSEFADEAKRVFERNFALYDSGFDVLMKYYLEQKKKEELEAKVSVLDSLRFLIPIAAHTTIILGGNARSVMEHFTRMLSYDDNFTQGFVKSALVELQKVVPGYYENIAADAAAVERNKKLQKYADGLFKRKFEPVKENVTLMYQLPVEEQALAQIVYPFCTVPFKTVYEKVSSFNDSERKELLKIATEDRRNRTNPIRGFETRAFVYEIEAPWALWKDFKRNRMNLRFQQDMRGGAGFDTSDLINETGLNKDYTAAMDANSKLIEKVYQKYGKLSETVAAQGSRKRFLLTMGPRQLTVICELRTCGEGDKGYRRIASRMIELAQEKNPRLYGHIHDNYKIPEKT
jgi:thymidylate synthase ThyX